MQNKKTQTLNLRLAPRTKAALREASAHANRSMGNLLEVLIFEYCETHGLSTPLRAEVRRSVPKKMR